VFFTPTPQAFLETKVLEPFSHISKGLSHEFKAGYM
jgi:hypothetical protein